MGAKILLQEFESVAPVAWITKESLLRLSKGGNGAKGTVPIHAEKSSVAVTPVYLTATIPSVDKMQKEITRLNRAIIEKNKMLECAKTGAPEQFKCAFALAIAYDGTGEL